MTFRKMVLTIGCLWVINVCAITYNPPPLAEIENDIDLAIQASYGQEQTDRLLKLYGKIDDYILKELNNGSSQDSIQRGLIDIQYLKLPLFIPKYKFSNISLEENKLFIAIYQVEGNIGPCGVRFFLQMKNASYGIIWKNEEQKETWQAIFPDVNLVNMKRYGNKMFFFIICSNTAMGQLKQSMLLFSYNYSTHQVVIEKQFLSKKELDAYFDNGKNTLEISFYVLENDEKPWLLKSYYLEKHILSFSLGNELIDDQITKISGRKAYERETKRGYVGTTIIKE